jgi:hypothetical protein
MNTVVMEHVPIAELPAAWQERLGGASEARVTVLIEPKPESEVSLKDATPPEFADDPSFGMWRDREDMADVDAYIRRIRAPRFPRGPSSDEH